MNQSERFHYENRAGCSLGMPGGVFSQQRLAAGDFESRHVTVVACCVFKFCGDINIFGAFERTVTAG